MGEVSPLLIRVPMGRSGRPARSGGIEKKRGNGEQRRRTEAKRGESEGEGGELRNSRRKDGKWRKDKGMKGWEQEMREGEKRRRGKRMEIREMGRR